jgi:hypothetical protein
MDTDDEKHRILNGKPERTSQGILRDKWEDNNKIDNGNKSLHSIKGEKNFDWLSNYQLLHYMTLVTQKKFI